MTEATQVVAAPGSLPDLVRAAQLPEPAERRRIRDAANCSLRRMAEELGVSIPTVHNWENGKDGPSLENAVAYRKLLDELKAATAS